MKKKGIIIFVVCVLLIPAHGFYTCGQGTNNEYVELKKNSTIYEAYTLFSPLQSKVTYLINNSFEVVHTWNSQYNPGNSVYLLENGNLFRTAFLVPNANKKFQAGGMGGCVEEIDWEGNVVWDFTYSSDQYLLHHDIEKLPNGNILMIAWEYKSSEEAITAGRNPELLRDNELWPDHIIEIQPTGSQGGEIVWEWHIWDHLIQDYDRAKENYGVVSKHPELIDLNYIGSRGPEAKGADWNHINSIDYNEEFDQILLSVHGFNEIWIIDHSTTTEEAAGHSGGNSGKGGDILYRWGNPQAYRAGGIEDQQFFGQHDAKWIEKGLPGEGNILVFNNGAGREGRDKGYSTVEEIKTPISDVGNYTLEKNQSYGPEKPLWYYRSEDSSFYSQRISGAQRLPNGNTLICSGDDGRFFEVTMDYEIVWEYINPFTDGKKTPKGKINNAVFRAEKYSPDFSGLRDKFSDQ